MIAGYGSHGRRSEQTTFSDVRSKLDLGVNRSFVPKLMADATTLRCSLTNSQYLSPLPRNQLSDGDAFRMDT
jgi:hypothetical protein